LGFILWAVFVSFALIPRLPTVPSRSRFGEARPDRQVKISQIAWPFLSILPCLRAKSIKNFFQKQKPNSF